MYRADPMLSLTREQLEARKLRAQKERRAVDFAMPSSRWALTRLAQRDYRDLDAIQPNGFFNRDWTPEGRRLLTGAQTGEFTLWNGLTFNFETILQAHEAPVRALAWSHSGLWLASSDHSGVIKYWQSTLNNVKAFQAHREAIRDLSFSPTDDKFASCSDDGLLKIWDFVGALEERTLAGHGWDVKCVDWHPSLGVIVSGSKDNLIKLWDPRTGDNVATLHGHKNTVVKALWNKNGWYLATGSRDQLVKVYDVRSIRGELYTLRGHRKEVSTLTWHPHHEDLLTSGGADGSIYFWLLGREQPQAEMGRAHEQQVWALAWHPAGHVLASSSNDHSTKFWCRTRPAEALSERAPGVGGAAAAAAAAAAGELKRPLAGVDADLDSIPGLRKRVQLDEAVEVAPAVDADA